MEGREVNETREREMDRRLQPLTEFPGDLGEREPEAEDIERCFVSGAYIEYAGVRLLTYLPAKAHNGSPQLIVIPPTAADAQVFLRQSGLMELADKKQFFVHVLWADEGAWDIGQAGVWGKNVIACVSARKRYVGCASAVYLLGVGDGAAAACRIAAVCTEAIAGMVCVGGGVPDGADEKIPEDTGAKTGDADAGLPLPVWLWAPPGSGWLERTTAFWRQHNGVSAVTSVQAGGNLIYRLPCGTRISPNEETEASQVRVTASLEKPAARDLERMWDFLASVRRHKGPGHPCLRFYHAPERCNAVSRFMEHAGVRRRWLEYIPSTPVPEAGYPLVVVLHGRGGTAESFFDASRMWMVAEERGFIALFPQAYCYQQYPPDGVRNVSMWDYPDGSLQADNVGFIRRMVEEAAGRYPVDRSRIYCCGQSSGGMMTMDLALYASDLFAAAAPWSTASIPDGKRTVTKEAIPVFLMRGKEDGLPRQKTFAEYPFRCNSRLKAMLDYFLERYGLEKEAREYESGIYHYYVYCTSKGVPMVTFVDVEGLPHASIPEESWMAYDLFLSKFSRGGEGELLYMGKRLE